MSIVPSAEEDSHIIHSPQNVRKIALFWFPQANNEEEEFVAWIHRGLYLGYENNDVCALCAFNMAIRQKPKHFLGYFYRSIVYKSLERRQKAIEDYEYILQHCRETLPLHYDLIIEGRIIEFSDPAKALVKFEQCAELLPNDFYAHFYYGLNLRTQRRNEEALKELERALEIGSPISNASVLSFIGHLYGTMDNKLSVAYDYFNRSLEAYPRALSSIISIASLKCFKEQKYDEAIEVLDKYKHLYPIDVLVHKGYIYWASNKQEQAVESLETAIKLDPYSIALNDAYYVIYKLYYSRLMHQILLLKYRSNNNNLFSNNTATIAAANNTNLTNATATTTSATSSNTTLLNATEDTLRQAATKVMKYLNDSLHNTFHDSAVRKLAKAKLELLQTIEDTPALKGQIVDSQPDNRFWTENRWISQFRDRMYKESLSANNFDSDLSPMYQKSHKCDVIVETVLPYKYS